MHIDRTKLLPARIVFLEAPFDLLNVNDLLEAGFFVLERVTIGLHVRPRLYRQRGGKQSSDLGACFCTHPC